jgi:prepilin-type N-terminal cleavage/methylation domain-containing protein
MYGRGGNLVAENGIRIAIKWVSGGTKWIVQAESLCLNGDMNMQNKQKGFSLIELLIVVAIILIIAAIAIPNLLRSKMSANESSAVATLRTLNTSAVSYSTTYGNYPPSLASLGPVASGTAPTSTTADLVDSVLGQDPATKSGYTFVYAGSGSPVSSYTITATPLNVGTTGQRGFFTNQSGVIRADPSGAATSASTPIS